MTTENPTPQKRSSNYISNEQALHNYEVIFTNLITQPEIKIAMAEYGYDEAKVNEGKELYTAARTAYDNNRSEIAQSTAARAAFDAQADTLFNTYATHRRHTKVYYRRQPEIIKQLNINGQLPRAFAARLQEAQNFYNLLAGTPALLTPLATFKITADTVKEAQKQIDSTLALRAEYFREKGESQDATKVKDAAFRAIEMWLSDMFAVARIALEDTPQLLEALTKVIRS